MRTLRRRWMPAAGLCAIAATMAAIAASTFSPGQQPIAWIAQPELTAYDLASNNETIFISDYETTFWSGNLYAYRISAAGQVDRTTNRWPTGGAAQALAELDWNTARKIVTRGGAGTGVPFRWANLISSDQTALGSQNVLNYLRGDRSNESPNGTNLRSRRHILGDILRSKPHYVRGTTSVVYVGANDGMLHAFDAATGVELYAYVPSMLIAKMSALAPAVPTLYTHTHFVDASPNSGMVGSMRVLAGGLGAGGKGLWALNITADATTPPTSEAEAASRVLWEINDQTGGFNDDLGYTYGEVRIRKVNTGVTAVIVPNGYLSVNGKAKLFVIDAATGSLIRSISTNAGNAANPNGLSSVALVDGNGDGTADIAYAGDLDGNLWKFDLSSADPNAWSATKLFTTSPAQAITGSPSVSLHPRGGLMVLFGTGKAFTSADLDDTSVHYLYGVRDGAAGGATTIQTQTLTERTYTMPNGLPVRVRTVTMNPMDWTTHVGWKLPLPAGERTLGDRTQVTNTRFFLHTYNPTVGSGTDRRGENWALQIDYLSGGGAVDPFIDMNLDGKVDDGDRVGVGTGPTTVPVGTFLEAGVFSQPLLVNSGAYLRDVYSENANLPPIFVDAPVGTGSGVSGGHFDVDIYYPGSCGDAGGAPLCLEIKGRKHFHEYDDTFDVTGVNMLNASSSTLNLSNALPVIGANTEFKVLAMNQYLNPAAKLSVGGAGYVSVKNYAGQASQANASFVTGLPSYTAATISTLVMNLPLDAFATKDWWGNGDLRVGLMPTQTGCVNKTSTGKNATVPSSSVWDPTPGLQGERHNGALTVQLIRANTPPSALEMNVPGKPEYGWRVNINDFMRYVLVEWTFFWHHPNGQCYKPGANWVKDPPQDPTSGGKPTTPPAGTADPRDGAFRIGNLTAPSNVTEISRTVVESGDTITLTIRWSDNTVITLTFTDHGDGTMTVTQSDNKGNSATELLDARSANSLLQSLGRNSTAAGVLINLPSLTRSPKVGRLSWRELLRN